MLDLIRGNNFVQSEFYNTSLRDLNHEITVVTSSDTRELVDGIFEKFNASVMDTSCLTEESKLFIKNHLVVNKEKLKQIEVETIVQSDSACWYEERSKRITSSNFGAVVNRRKGQFPTSLLKKLIHLKYKSFTSDACKWGRDQEKVAIIKYERENHLKVTKCGFFVNPRWPWLGCSPDGLVNNVKCIEVKCPLSKKDVSISEACEDKTFFMKLSNGKPELKENHVYWYQCQSVMAITETEEIDFVVYTEKSLHIQNIKFQEEKWNDIILPCLTDFYFKYMAQEIFKTKI